MGIGCFTRNSQVVIVMFLFCSESNHSYYKHPVKHYSFQLVFFFFSFWKCVKCMIAAIGLKILVTIAVDQQSKSLEQFLWWVKWWRHYFLKLCFHYQVKIELIGRKFGVYKYFFLFLNSWYKNSSISVLSLVT